MAHPPADGYTRYAGVGLQFAATIGLFAWAGYALDDRLGTSPWLLIVGVFLGFAGAMISLVRRVPGGKGGPRGDRNQS